MWRWRRKRTGAPPPRGLQPLVLAPVRQKLGGAHGPRGGVQQKLAPEIPPRTLVPPVRGVQPHAPDPEFLPQELAPPMRGGEFWLHGGARERLEIAHRRHGPGDEPEHPAD